MNRGVFVELLTLLAEAGDDVIAGHLNSAANNAKYTSPQIQNEMISIIGSSIQEIISKQVREAEVFSILMDETTDVSHREQVAMFVRFVQDLDGVPVIQERMLALAVTNDVTGQ